MSGLLRNIIAFLWGLLAYKSKAVGSVTNLIFWVTPFDSGIRVLKSDKYLQFAESAQIDYLIKVGKLFTIIHAGASFVNVAQLVKFTKPVPMCCRRLKTDPLGQNSTGANRYTKLQCCIDPLVLPRKPEVSYSTAHHVAEVFGSWG